MNRRIRYVLAAVGMAGGCAEADRTATEPELLTVPLFSHQGAHGARNFGTHATGREEVPPNESRAQGEARFQLSQDGTALSYVLIVANIENVAQAHIHLAPAGTNGPITAWLYPSAPPAQLIPGRSQGVLGEGTITDTDLVGPLAGLTIADLLDAIRSGNAYVNVHTSQFPPGEIRGQLD